MLRRTGPSACSCCSVRLGTGKTRTVEALAEALHGSSRNVLKIDCGEFQMEHEVAKLIGAPPGYLGHRETQPMLSQQKLTSVTSDKCGLSLVLFDEIEKAAPSLTRLLLGVLDRGVLRLGDNSVVNFEKSLVFLTSNLGAKEMMREINPDFGFASATVSGTRDDLTQKLQGIALVAVRKKFSPEFINRIDHVITYQPLDAESFSAITDHEIASLQSHVNTRLGNRCFTIEVPFETRQWLIEQGTSAGIRRARTQADDSQASDAAARHAGGEEPDRARIAGSRRDRSRSGVVNAAGNFERRGAGAFASDGSAGGRQPRSAAVSGAADGGIGLGTDGGGERERSAGNWWRSASRMPRCSITCCRTETASNWRSS